MGYMHIDLLHKCPEFFTLFDEVYIMEKIHGTSAWLIFDKKHASVRFHSGGENSKNFEKNFNKEFLDSQYATMNYTKMKVHGEAYGGKQQKMKDTYGAITKFIVFDVYVEDDEGSRFLDVPSAESIAKQLDLEFVHYIRSINTPQAIEDETKRESIQAIRNGMGPDKLREGVVIRPLIESSMPFRVQIAGKTHIQDNKRAIFKYKNEKFWEITTRRPLGEALKVVSDIDIIVNDWVTNNRLQHVIDRVIKDKENKTIEFKDISRLLELMIEDVTRESSGEVLWTKSLDKAIRRKTAVMFKKYLNDNEKQEPSP